MRANERGDALRRQQWILEEAAGIAGDGWVRQLASPQILHRGSHVRRRRVLHVHGLQFLAYAGVVEPELVATRQQEVHRGYDETARLALEQRVPIAEAAGRVVQLHEFIPLAVEGFHASD